MNLSQITQLALDYTRRLEAALNLDDLDLCREILEVRGQAMATFETIHRQASSQERDACRSDIGELVAADRMVQEKSAVGLESIARDFRKNMASNQATAQNSYMAEPAQACVDRKA